MSLESLIAAARARAPGAALYAHLRVASRGRARDYLLSDRTLVADDVTLLHWERAPLAEVFFSTPTGAAYELTEGARTLEGTVLARHLLTFAPDGALASALDPEGTLALHGRDAAARRRPLSAVDVILDADQRRAVERPPGDALLVLGEAGVGKTTVALHRLATLARARRGGGFKAAVIVPTEGLRRLSEALLARLEVEGVEVAVYDRWAASLARAAFPGIPWRESEDARAGVIRLKRHRALAPTLRAYAKIRKPGRVTREDLHHLFGDRVWMERVARESAGALSPRDVDDVLEHTRVQYSETTEEAFAHVDADRLQAVDGRALDAGTTLNDAGTVDVEDYAALFALDAERAAQQGHSSPPPPRRYDALVLDEAQELAPLELSLLGRALAPGGTLVVAGDEGQQVDATACFEGWHRTMRDLGARAFETARLTMSYRCPPAVTALARRVLDPARAVEVVDPVGALSFLRASSACHIVARLVDALRALRAEDPGATVAVIARTAGAARSFAQRLGRGVEVHLALRGDFRFTPGVQVTCVQEVKGLEFDHVVIPDADGPTYPDDPAARRALYVALTRASHEVLLATTADWSPLLGTSPPLRANLDACEPRSSSG